VQGSGTDSSLVAVSPQATKSTNQEGSCHYFLLGPRLPPQPLSMTTHWLVTITLHGDRGTCVSNLPRVASDSAAAGIRTCSRSHAKSRQSELEVICLNVNELEDVQHMHSAYVHIWVRLLGSFEVRCTEDDAFDQRCL